MARSLEDVLSRRTRALVLDARAALECAPAVAQVIARELGRDEPWVQSELNAFERRARESLLS
jgi:glycerol-3-phosphate dehydrogenase